MHGKARPESSPQHGHVAGTHHAFVLTVLLIKHHTVDARAKVDMSQEPVKEARLGIAADEHDAAVGLEPNRGHVAGLVQGEVPRGDAPCGKRLDGRELAGAPVDCEGHERV